MPIATFNPSPKPSPGTTRKPELKLLKAEFGDGYSQTTRDGLNHIRRTLSLKWELLTVEQNDAFETFFRTAGGDQPFWYTPSNESIAVKWTCEEWDSRTREDGFLEFSANLKQSFNPIT